jgi:hypothetical protein
VLFENATGQPVTAGIAAGSQVLSMTVPPRSMNTVTIDGK